MNKMNEELITTPDYERGFVDGMQKQTESSVYKALAKIPTKIFGPDLEPMLNNAGFYKKHEWVGLTDDEATSLWENTHNNDSWELIKRVEAKLKEKNT